MKRITLPLHKDVIRDLQLGEELLLSGICYGARDAAHKRLTEALQKGEAMPVDFTGETIYYVGPCPACPGEIIGPAGPTTSSRMDSYAPLLLDNGLLGMIGKGQRSEEVIAAVKRNGAVYLGAIGGAGALLADCIKEAEVIAYPELGPEALWRFRFEDFPVIVVIDANGNNLYSTGPDAYRKEGEI